MKYLNTHVEINNYFSSIILSSSNIILIQFENKNLEIIIR